MAKQIKKLTDVKPQAKNANQHTSRGMDLLEDSIQKDGWIGAITVAADGETFDGSARVEVGSGAGFEDAIVIESDGSKPVIVKRTDIASADDPKAKRLGVAANRIAQIDLSWDASIMADMAAQGVELPGWDENELADLTRRSDAAIERINMTDDWVGMPEFEAVESPYKIIVNFDNEADREEFARQHDLKFLKKESRTWSTWHPFRERKDLASIRYEEYEE